MESSGQMWIDSTVGNDTVIACSWNTTKIPDVSIKSPTADCYYASHDTKSKLNLCADHPIHTIDENFKVLKFNIPGTCEVFYCIKLYFTNKFMLFRHTSFNDGSVCVSDLRRFKN